MIIPLAISGCLVRTGDTKDMAILPTSTIGRNQFTATLGFISAQTNQSQYDGVDGVKLIVLNATSSDIRIPAPPNAQVGERTFRFYKKTLMGWKRLFPIPGYLAEPIAPAPEMMVQAGQKVELSMAHIMGSYTEWKAESVWLAGDFIVQIRYDPPSAFTGDEFVQYSNEFAISTTVSITKTNVEVHLVRSQPLAFELQNNSNVPLWFPVACSSAPPIAEGSVFRDDGYVSLQRLTEDKTWQIIRLAKTDCKEKTTPIRIDPGQTATIDGSSWFQERVLDAGVGSYRWDVVFYLEEFDAGAGTRALNDARHVFSDIFKLDQ